MRPLPPPNYLSRKPLESVPPKLPSQLSTSTPIPLAFFPCSVFSLLLFHLHSQLCSPSHFAGIVSQRPRQLTSLLTLQQQVLSQDV